MEREFEVNIFDYFKFVCDDFLNMFVSFIGVAIKIQWSHIIVY